MFRDSVKYERDMTGILLWIFLTDHHEQPLGVEGSPAEEKGEHHGGCRETTKVTRKER
jgi:hypothetical protein